jgi:DNA-directed RNA polymerase subunit RPC12/RpoP
MARNEEYICSNCGKNVSLDDDFCPHCGEDIREVEEEYVCSNCGGEVSENDAVCPFCGEDVKEIDNTALLPWRERTSILSLKPTFSKDGGWILTITGWTLLATGTLALIAIPFFRQTYLRISLDSVYWYLKADTPIQLTSALLLLVLGFFARRGVVFYLYIGLALFILNAVRYAGKMIYLSFNAGYHPICYTMTVLYLLPVAFFGWLLIKSLPAYRKWHRENKPRLDTKKRAKNLIKKLRGRNEDFE